jgi:hypothetical protein
MMYWVGDEAPSTMLFPIVVTTAGILLIAFSTQ